MREFFTREEENNLVHLEVEMDAFAYRSDYPWLFSLFIKFDASDKSSGDLEEFFENREALIIALEHKDRAKYVGMRSVDGWSELYFYANDSKELDAIATTILSSTPYIYENSVVRDTKWDFHHKNLKPTELELCHIESQKIISMLEEEGDDLASIRPVEHYISFELPTQKDRFINTLNIDGYTLKDEISSEEFEHGIALLKKHDVQSTTLYEEVSRLFSAIKKAQGYYEGWSTVLASEVEE